MSSLATASVMAAQPSLERIFEALIEMLFEHFDRFLEKCDESSCPEFAILEHGTFNRRRNGDAMQIHLSRRRRKDFSTWWPSSARAPHRKSEKL